MALFFDYATSADGRGKTVEFELVFVQFRNACNVREKQFRMAEAIASLLSIIS
jgi:hypothetical protein